MRIRRTPPFPMVLMGLFTAGLLPAAIAAPVVTSVPVAPYGDASRGSISAPVPLSSRSFLVAAEGADGTFTTADDVVLLVNGVGGSTVVTPLATPFLPAFSGRVVRLSATRALVSTAGADGEFQTADDAVLLLDRLGSANTVTPLVIGGFRDVDGYAPVALSARSAVVASMGPDLTFDTADDILVLLQDLGTTNTVTALTAPSLDSLQSRVTVLTPTSMLVASNGPDRTLRTADDQVYLFTGLGSSNTRTDLAVPGIFQRGPRQPVRLSATRAIITTTGPDHQESTADDALVLMDGLGTTNTVTSIPVPSIHDFGAGVSVSLSDTTVILSTEGPDSVGASLDDQVAIVSGLGTTNAVTLLSVGSLAEDAASRSVRLSPTRVALCTGGITTATFNNADDDVVVIDGVGTTNTVTRIPMPGLSSGVSSTPVPLSSSAFLINHGGADGVMGQGSDDQVALVTGTGTGYTLENTPILGHINTYAAPSVAAPLGRGRAVLLSPGANNQSASGDDDLMRILSGLPQVRGIEVKKLSIAFNPARPAQPETFSASGIFATDDPGLLLSSDVTMSVGNAAQTIPIGLFKRSRTGVYTYADSKHRNGILTKVTLDPAKHKFSVSGKGTGTGLRATTASYVPVAIGGFREYFADAVTARGSGKALKFP